MDTYELLPKTWWLKEPQDSRATVRDLNSLWYEFYASLVAAPRLTPQVMCYSHIVQGEPKFQGLSHVKGQQLTQTSTTKLSLSGIYSVFVLPMRLCAYWVLCSYQC